MILCDLSLRFDKNKDKEIRAICIEDGRINFCSPSGTYSRNQIARTPNVLTLSYHDKEQRMAKVNCQAKLIGYSDSEIKSVVGGKLENRELSFSLTKREISQRVSKLPTFYGLQLGGVLDINQCSLGGNHPRTCYRDHSSYQFTGRTISIYYPTGKAPAMECSGALVTLINGTIEQIRMYTCGVSVSSSDIVKLEKKYGAATSKTIEQYHNLAGATYQGQSAIWIKDGYTIEYSPVAGSSHTEGIVSLETNIARESRLQRERERNNKQQQM